MHRQARRYAQAPTSKPMADAATHTVDKTMDACATLRARAGDGSKGSSAADSQAPEQTPVSRMHTRARCTRSVQAARAAAAALCRRRAVTPGRAHLRPGLICEGSLRLLILGYHLNRQAEQARYTPIKAPRDSGGRRCTQERLREGVADLPRCDGGSAHAVSWAAHAGGARQPACTGALSAAAAVTYVRLEQIEQREDFVYLEVDGVILCRIDLDAVPKP